MNFGLEIKFTVNLSWFLLTMWAKHDNLQSKWLREIAQVQVLTTAFIDGREICFLKYKFSYEILSVHHNCNPNDQQNSHKLQIRTASSKNRKMNFRLEIKLTVNSSWFREAMWAKHKQSEIRMVKRNSTNASSNNCLYGGERNLLSAIKLFL